MNITNKDFKALTNFFLWFAAEDHSYLAKTGITEKQIIADAAAVLDALHEKKKAINSRAAAYIAEKRKFNKNYARSKKQNKDA